MKTFCKKKTSIPLLQGEAESTQLKNVSYQPGKQNKDWKPTKKAILHLYGSDVNTCKILFFSALLSSPSVPSLNFVVEMGGRKLHPPLYIQYMLKIAWFLQKGLYILETSEKELIGSFLIVRENTIFASWLRKCCPDLSSGHLNNCSSLVKWQN